MREDNKVNVLESQSEEMCVTGVAYKHDSVTPVLSEGMGQNSRKILSEACGRTPKTYQIVKVCTPLTVKKVI